MKLNLSIFFLIICGMLLGCNSQQYDHYELIKIKRAYVNELGYPTVDFEITNSTPYRICIPEGVVVDEYTNFSKIEVKDKKAKRKKQRRGYRIILGSQMFIPLEKNKSVSGTLYFRSYEKNEIGPGHSVRILFETDICIDDRPRDSNFHYYSVSNWALIE